MTAVIGSANRDPEANADPDGLDITREEVRHMAFGGGIHYSWVHRSPGGKLSTALVALLKEAPALRLACESPLWRPAVLFRGLASLPVALG